MTTKLRAIDVCAGAGGWAVAARGLPIEIVAALDREEDALATYKINHPSVECVNCDVLTYDFAKWRGIDLILGGIPCETLSVARNNIKPGQTDAVQGRACGAGLGPETSRAIFLHAARRWGEELR